MTNNEIKTTVNELFEMETLLEETRAIVEGLKDILKEEMTRRDVETIETPDYIIRWTNVLSQRFDTSAFKKFAPDIYNSFTKPVPSRKFSISR